MLCWTKSGKNGHPYFVSEFRRKHFSSSSLSITCWLSIYILYYIKVFSLCTKYIENFYQERMSIYVKHFFCVYWDDHVVLFLLCIECITLIDFRCWLNLPSWGGQGIPPSVGLFFQTSSKSCEVFRGGSLWAQPDRGGPNLSSSVWRDLLASCKARTPVASPQETCQMKKI